jgi:hypothetical protein
LRTSQYRRAAVLSRSWPDGKVMVIRAKPGADKPDRVVTFVADLKDPYGIAFYPPAPATS